MRRRKPFSASMRESWEDLLMLAELIGYLALVGAVFHFVQTVPWYDALIGSTFILVMVVRRFRRWLGSDDDVERPS